jgi:transcriptional regulator with XRE-family HTH domain
MVQLSRFSGSKIRQARHEAGMTQAALARAAGTRERNIIRWENDQHAPRFEHVAAIARATGKDIAFFAQESSDEDEESRTVAGMSLDEILRLHVRALVRDELMAAQQ